MELKAKTVSLIIKIVDVIIAVVFFVLKGLKILDISVGEICAICGIIAGVFGDVSLNTAFDKFTKKVE